MKCLGKDKDGTVWVCQCGSMTLRLTETARGDLEIERVDGGTFDALHLANDTVLLLTEDAQRGVHHG